LERRLEWLGRQLGLARLGLASILVVTIGTMHHH
jgi:hypothetical protein